MIDFTPADRQSVLFKRLKDAVEKELAQLRERNDGNHDEVVTADIRGQIKMLKKIQADMKEKPAPKPAQNRNPYQ